MDIAIPIFERITALDAIGPYEVLSRLPGATVHFLGVAGAGPVRTENGMLGLHADGALADLPRPDVIVFPGGYGTRALMSDDTVLEWVRRAAGLPSRRRTGQGDHRRRRLGGHRHGAVARRPRRRR